MATQAHCLYCFEALAASFERRQPMRLEQVENSWTEYRMITEIPAANKSESRDQIAEADSPKSTVAKPALISKLLTKVGATASFSDSSSNLSQESTTSSPLSGSKDTSGSVTPASSVSSKRSDSTAASPPAVKKRRHLAEYPLFVTWNTVSRNGHKSLRGCIGTFEAQELEHGLRSYALTSAFDDIRFQPIPASLLPSLSSHVTLLTDFSTPTTDPMDWTIGKHGLRISFASGGRRYGSTYLPDVAKEQAWTKEETLISLMRKAGWNGSSSSWEKAWKDGRGELVTYEGKQVGIRYSQWREWRDWVDKQSSMS